MSMKKKAFTMIELIFVIVILGILAAVAIPKLAATRTDAELSMLAQNIMTGCSEIASFAIAQGNTDDNLNIMSNSISTLSNSGIAVLTPKKAVIKVGGDTNCVTIEILKNTTDDNLSLTVNLVSLDEKCLNLQTIIDTAKYPMKLRGQYVKR